MNKLAYKIVASAMSAGLVLGIFATSVFAEEKIVGNGANSTNTIVVTNTNNCTVTQGNATFVLASVSAKANTGGNTASGNTGDGDVTIDTGKADATATVIVTGGDNTITDPCCCANAVPPADRTIKDNGKDSTSTIVSTDTQTNSTTQGGITGVGARVRAKAKTGKNRSNNNTGNGAVSVTTDNATSTTGLTVTGGSNTL